MDAKDGMITIAAKMTTFMTGSLAVKAFIRRQRRPTTRPQGGSRSGRTPKQNIGSKEAGLRLEGAFLINNMQYNEVTKDNGPTLSKNYFERRLRIPRVIYERIKNYVVAEDDYVKMGRYCTELEPVTTYQKLVASITQLSLDLSTAL